MFFRLGVWILIRALWTSWTWHSAIATHLRNTTLNSTWNSSGNQHSGSLVSKNLIAKTQYGIKGNFFVNHFSFIINCHIYISSLSVLDYKCLISPEFQKMFRYMLWWKPLIGHFHHVIEASGSSVLSVAQRVNPVYWWSLGWGFESWILHYEQAEHDILSLPHI